MTRKQALLIWLLGLLTFLITLLLHTPLILTEVPGGILDHQKAGVGAEITRIQAAWQAAGVYGEAKRAMISDLVFIVCYSAATIVAGRYLMRVEGAGIRRIGLIVAIAAVVFFVTDITETSAQLMQLTNGEGSDDLASLAATVRPIKIATWIMTFFGVLGGFALEYRAMKRAG